MKIAAPKRITHWCGGDVEYIRADVVAEAFAELRASIGHSVDNAIVHMLPSLPSLGHLDADGEPDGK